MFQFTNEKIYSNIEWDLSANGLTFDDCFDTVNHNVILPGVGVLKAENVENVSVKKFNSGSPSSVSLPSPVFTANGKLFRMELDIRSVRTHNHSYTGTGISRFNIKTFTFEAIMDGTNNHQIFLNMIINTFKGSFLERELVIKNNNAAEKVELINSTHSEVANGVYLNDIQYEFHGVRYFEEDANGVINKTVDLDKEFSENSGLNFQTPYDTSSVVIELPNLPHGTYEHLIKSVKLPTFENIREMGQYKKDMPCPLGYYDQYTFRLKTPVTLTGVGDTHTHSITNVVLWVNTLNALTVYFIEETEFVLTAGGVIFTTIDDINLLSGDLLNLIGSDELEVKDEPVSDEDPIITE